MTQTTERHPATTHLISLFTYEHLAGELRDISQECCDLAASMFDKIKDNPELTTGLRKLLEAKDCFVRAMVASRRDS